MTTIKTAKPAAKRPAKKTTPATEPQAKPPAIPTITFAGRTMRVQAPTAEQIGVWRRTASRFESMDITPAGGDSDEVLTKKSQKAGKLLDRGIRVIESVLTDTDDHDWLEDELLDKTLTLVEAAGILTFAADAYGQVEEAPKTGPAPKARRRR